MTNYHLLTVDPGVHGLGVAVGNKTDGSLVWAGYIPLCDSEPAAWVEAGIRAVALLRRLGVRPREVVVERMTYYGEMRSGGKGGAVGGADDLLRVQSVGAAVLAAVGGYCGAMPRAPRARDWKGQVPKEVHVRRTIKKVEAKPEWASVIELPTAPLAHNVWDAVGMMLWALTL